MLTTISPQEALKSILRTRSRPSALQAPALPGVYAVFLREMKSIGWFPCNDDGIVYIGKSGNLKAREFDVHFQAGKSGFSTLRRSLGAILKDDLQVKCLPRSSGPSKTNVTNYKFDPEGELRLSLWMAENLDIGFMPYKENISKLNKELIANLNPLLNLTGWQNPDRSAIKALRAACAKEAGSGRVSK